METKDVILELRTKKGLIIRTNWPAKSWSQDRQYPAGKWETSSEYGDVEAFVKGIRGVDQYASWCT